MKASILEDIVRKINGTYLNALCGEPLGGEEGGGASRRVPPVDVPAPNRCPNAERCFGGMWACPCFAGTPSWADINQAVTLQSPKTGQSGRVAVGVTIDKITKPSPGVDKNLPVVLAVGINYGQMGNHNYLAQPAPGKPRVPLWDATRMRPRLQTVVEKLAVPMDCRRVHPEFQSKCHLVATNFFPWITQNAWSTFNAIEEMLLLTCFGYCDPHAIIADICEKIGNELKAVVFHGANNAVPMLGRSFLQRHAASLWSQPEKPDVIFCDNFAPNANQEVVNAVRLCQRRLERIGIPDNGDD